VYAKNNKISNLSWPRVKFGDMVRQSKEKANPETSGLARYIAGDHMDTDDLRLRRWGDIGSGYLGPAFHMRFKPGQVLYGSRRTYLRKVAVADFDGICANTTFVLESKEPDVLLPQFLPFLMQTNAFNEFSVKNSKGSVNPYINFSDLARFEFALPPKAEQLRIVELLRQFELQAESYNDAFLALKKLKASLAQAEFVESNVRALPLNQLCSKSGIQIGPFGAQLHSYDYVVDGVPVVMPADMTNGKVVLDRIARVSEQKISELQQHTLRQGDILLPRRGDLDRRAWVSEVEEGWLCGTGSIRIRVADGVNPRGVFYALSMPATVSWLKANAVGTTMPNLNTKIVASIPIKLPRPERLNDVVKALDDFDSAEHELTTRRQTAAALRSQLLNSLWGE